VNRLLYGQRDEPYTVITRLSQRLEVTLAPDAVLSTIVETVAQALKLPYVAILLQQGEAFVLAASSGESVRDPLILPLVYQGETVGQLHLAPRTPGESLTPADRRLLDELARQAGLAAHAVQLTSDLRRSREHLEQRVEERTRELSTLLEVSHNVASTLELKPLLGLILDQLKTVVDYTDASIMTLEEEDLVIVDYRGFRPQEQMRGRRIPLRQARGIWEMIGRREPVIIDDVWDETPLAQAEREMIGDLSAASRDQLSSWMAAPLTLKDRVIGMVPLLPGNQAISPRAMPRWPWRLPTRQQWRSRMHASMHRRKN
jgi:transcriptional regulator with GAF, ATPase, and Fis domain